MFSFASGAWRWYFSDADDARKLGSAPEELMSRARMIRDTRGKRIVYADGEYFFKHELPQLKWTRYWQKRLFPRAQEEFRSLLRLSDMGFPTVRPAAYGIKGAESILITRAAAGTGIPCFATSDDLAAYLQQHPLQGCTVLVKGSRGTRMEKVIPSL